MLGVLPESTVEAAASDDDSISNGMDNLEPVKEEPVKEADKKELKKAIANAEKYTRVDYTEESWNDFQTALQAAYLVDNNTAATQKEAVEAANKDDVTQAEIDQKTEALKQAIGNLKNANGKNPKGGNHKNVGKNNKNNNGNAAKTGDNMPVIPIASAVAAFAVIAEIIRRRIKNR